MKFIMNGIPYKIIEKSKEEMFGSLKETDIGDSKAYLGLHFPTKGEIWLLESLSYEQKKRTLLHELAHCYIWCYMGDIETLNEENICNMVGNSHSIINEIAKKYFTK